MKNIIILFLKGIKMPRKEEKQTESGEKEPIIVLSSSESGGESEEEEESRRVYLDIPPRDELLDSLPKIPDVTYPNFTPYPIGPCPPTIGSIPPRSERENTPVPQYRVRRPPNWVDLTVEPIRESQLRENMRNNPQASAFTMDGRPLSDEEIKNILANGFVKASSLHKKNKKVDTVDLTKNNN